MVLGSDAGITFLLVETCFYINLRRVLTRYVMFGSCTSVLERKRGVEICRSSFFREEIKFVLKFKIFNFFHFWL